jgi:hypothetical protein
MEHRRPEAWLSVRKWFASEFVNEEGKPLRVVGDLGRAAGTVLLVILGCIALGFVIEYGSVKGYYALQNNVDPEKVTIIPKPHDCDFDKAPIGNKECHYEAVVTKDHDERGYYVIINWRRVDE